MGKTAALAVRSRLAVQPSTEPADQFDSYPLCQLRAASVVRSVAAADRPTDTAPFVDEIQTTCCLVDKHMTEASTLIQASGPQAVADANGPVVSQPCCTRHVTYRKYGGEEDLDDVIRLVDSELSEPYSVFTYRYFLNQWPGLCIFACDDDSTPVATIVGKVENHMGHVGGAMVRGYIAMLVVEKPFRGSGIGTELVRRVIQEMRAAGAQEAALEAETVNAGALAMYQSLGFICDKRLDRYYLSGTDAFRLKLLFVKPSTSAPSTPAECHQDGGATPVSM